MPIKTHGSQVPFGSRERLRALLLGKSGVGQPLSKRRYVVACGIAVVLAGVVVQVAPSWKRSAPGGDDSVSSPAGAEASKRSEAKAAKLPAFSKGQTLASRASAVAARQFREALHELHAAETKAQLVQRKRELARQRELLIQNADASLPAIQVLVRDPRQIVRAKAVGLLKSIGTKKAFALLSRTAADADRDVRLYALQQIEGWRAGKLVSKDLLRTQAVPVLLESLADEDERIRAAAFRVFRRVAQISLGYDPQAPAQERKQALHKLQEWWATERSNAG